MPIVDGLAVVAALGVALLGFVALRVFQRKVTPEITGAENAEKNRKAGIRKCNFCRKMTNPDVDIYTNNLWYHTGCYNNQDKDRK